MRDTKIVAGFPATGKTYVSKHLDSFADLMVLDSDSSNFSWILDEHGKPTDVRDRNFPQNYIDHIKKQMGSVDIIFVSSHKVVQEALQDNNINYIMFYPDINIKEYWLDRFKSRGNDENFISFIERNWESFILDIENNDFCSKVVLHEGEYIYDHLSRIISGAYD